MQDRFGLPITTSSATAAEHYQKGLDLVLSQNFGAEEELQKAVEADEGFAIATSCMAYVAMQRGRGAEAREIIKGVQSLSSGASKRERQQIEAVALWISGDGPRSVILVREHLDEFPRDALMLRLAQRLYMLGCYGSGVPNFPDELYALCKSIEKHCSDEWSFLGQFAFANHETGRLDEAMTLARRSLDLYPTNATACHSVTHAYFEQGNASDGGLFLGDWLEGFDRRAAYHVHLSWHLALFELALGRYQSALDLYESDIRPSVVEKTIGDLANSASLLWRLKLYSDSPSPMPWKEVSDQAVPAAANPGPAFRDAHAALAFAAAGDDESMSRLINGTQKLADKGSGVAREMTLPLLQGISAFAEGSYGEAARLMEPLAPQLARIGGSHAQREVFEDTLLEAYLRAEQFDKAEDMLRERLGRRASVRDTFWMGRVQASNGETGPARSTLKEAIDGWSGGDESSPEMTDLTALAETLG